jgi:hypothetical protein
MPVAQRDFELEVLREGIVVRHQDGHVLSYFRPEDPSVNLTEHSRYCEPGHEASFGRFQEEAKRAACKAAQEAGWLSEE